MEDEDPGLDEMMSDVTKALVLVPTYNEAAVIERLISRFSDVRKSLVQGDNDLAIDLQLLIIDDNSPDGTAELVEKMNLNWIRVMRREKKSGLGPAYIAGFKEALKEDFQLMIEMDADLSHQPEQLVDLMIPVINNRCDLTIGTRWMPGGKVINWPISRQLISRMGTGYARFALRLKLRDITSGFRVFHRRVIERIDLEAIEARGYGFQIEMTLRTLDAGFQVQEVPITFVEREGGVSKMSKKIVLEALWKVTIWGLRNLIKSR
jgi:dolichol-phosphate mannosyltransferase